MGRAFVSSPLSFLDGACGRLQEMETRGVVDGKRVLLEDPIPGLDGKRVRVRLDVLEDERVLSPREQSDIWRQWVESGPQGPIEDDTEGRP